MKTKITQHIKIIILGLVVALGVGYVSADWTAPTLPPTGGNVAAPINIGSIFQTKGGGIGMTDLIVSNSMQFAAGTPVAGKVLMATDNQGNMTWSNVSGYGTFAPTWSFTTLTAPEKTTKTSATTYNSANSICVASSFDNGGCDGGASYSISKTPTNMWKATLVNGGDCNRDASLTFMCTNL